MLGLALLGLIQRLQPLPVSAPRFLPLPFTASAHETSKALLLWCAYGAVLWGAPQVLSRSGALQRFAWAVFLIGLVVALIGIAQLSRGDPMTTPVYGFREVRFGRVPFGPYFNKNHAASLLAMSALAGGGIFISRFFGGRGERSPGDFADLLATQALLLFIIGIVLYGLLRTHSRGGLASVAAALWLAGWLACGLTSRRWRWVARGGLALAAAGAVALVCRHLGAIALGRGLLDSVLIRFSMYRSGWRLFNDFPLFGVGMGALVGASPAYKEPFISPIVDHIHNDWLELLLQFGLAGFVCYVAGLALFLRRVLKAWKALDCVGLKCLFAGVLAAALSFIVHGFVDFSFQIPANAVIFLALLCWLSAASRQLGEDAQAPARPATPWARGAFVACAALALMALSVWPTVAYLFSRRAEAAAAADKPQYLAKAYGWDPDPSYQNQLAVAYFNLAQAGPAPSQPLLRKALEHSSASLRAEPLNRYYREWQKAILRRLGRGDDAKRAF